MSETAALEPGRRLLKGDIAWCSFPYRNSKRKLHPVLILQVLEPAQKLVSGMPYFVVVSGGTSVYGPDGDWRQSSTRELHVRRSDPEFDDTNLHHATKFSFEKSSVVILPYTTKRFRLPKSSACPVIGHLDLNTARMKARLNVVSHAVDGLDRLIQEKIAVHNAAQQK